MARPKGSKNKTRAVKSTVDYVAVVVEKTTEKEKIESEVAVLIANIDDLKAQLKTKKDELKAATKDLTKAEAKKAAIEKKAAEESQKGRSRRCAEKAACQRYDRRRNPCQAPVIAIWAQEGWHEGKTASSNTL